MNNNVRDDEDKAEKMRLLTELVMLAMEDVEYQLKCLDMEQIEDKPVHVKASFDAMNKAKYYIYQLEGLA